MSRPPHQRRHLLASAALAGLLCASGAPAGSLTEIDLTADGTSRKLAQREAEDARVGFAGMQLEHDAEAAPRLRALPRQQGSKAAAGPPLSTARALLHGEDSLHAFAASPGADDYRLLEISRLRGGAHLLRFAAEREGIEIFREGVSVLLDADGWPRALSGGGSGPALTAQAKRSLDAAAAVGRALEDYGFPPQATRSSLRHESTRGRYRRYALPLLLNTSAEGAEVPLPARVKPVWFRLRGELRSAWYVETRVIPTQGPRSLEYYAHVVDAADGRLLFRMNQTAHQAYTYRVFADPDAYALPLSGPQGRADQPFPGDGPVALDPPWVPRADITLAQSPLVALWPGSGFADPWLGAGAGVSTGNHVDAYADLAEPDGFGPGDRRAQETSTGSFRPALSPLLDPDATPDQIDAGVVNAFYIANSLHDWFYLAGFDEAAGNAQASNYGRGGLEGDRMLLETLDFSATNNANMTTPADGESPRMQLFRFRGPVRAGVQAGALDLRAHSAEFGAAAFDLQGPLLAVNGSPCGALAEVVPGSVVLLRRGPCSPQQQAATAQAAGAAGLLLSHDASSGYPGLAGADPSISLPVLGLRLQDDQALRTQLAQGTVQIRLWAQRGPPRDSALDAAIVAHEWGHYVSNRLIGDGTGLFNLQGRGLGEGWSDYHALMLMLRPEHANHPSGVAFGGSYGVMSWISDGLFPSFAPYASYYGIRRWPYSVRTEVNPISFRHVANNAVLPQQPPRTPAPVAINNAAVHNAGELWASALLGCHVALLQQTLGPAPRLSFDEVQRRMSEYLVAAYKLTPVSPTFTEAAEALRLAIAVSDLQDLALCGDALAARGLGLRARSAPRTSLSLNGVEESFASGGDLSIDAVRMELLAECDGDDILDPGEKAALRIDVRNSGTRALADSWLQLSSDSQRLRFADGALWPLQPSQPQQSQQLQVPIELLPGGGRSAIRIDLVPQDPGIPFPTGQPGATALAVDFDELAGVSRSDDFATRSLAWATPLDEGLDPEIAAWRRRPLDPLRWVAWGPDFGTPGTAWLESPELEVAHGEPLSVEFEARYSFEAWRDTWYDGGVIEFSLDEGATWRDVTEVASLQPGYGGELSDCCDNPLSGRAAFVGDSPGWPKEFDTYRIDFGNALAGARLRLRFGVATDAAVGAPGWEIDEVRIRGIVNRPFPQVVPNATACKLDGRFVDGFEAQP